MISLGDILASSNLIGILLHISCIISYVTHKLLASRFFRILEHLAQSAVLRSNHGPNLENVSSRHVSEL